MCGQGRHHGGHGCGCGEHEYECGCGGHHHHHGGSACDCYGGGGQCGCREHEGGCDCEKGRHEHGRCHGLAERGVQWGFQRRFKSRSEYIAELEAYLQALQAEAKAVEEHLADLKAAA